MNGCLIDLDKPRVSNREIIDIAIEFLFNGRPMTGPFTWRSCGPPFYVPAFNRTSQHFDRDFGFVLGDVLFEGVWTPPKDCTGDELIDVGALPKLPKLSKAKPENLEPTVEPASPPPALPAPTPQQQPNAINFTWTPPNTQRYLHGG
jgi:hypothetical protein